MLASNLGMDVCTIITDRFADLDKANEAIWNSMAMAALKSAVNPSYLSSIKVHKTAHAAWNSLKRLHADSSIARVTQLDRELVTFAPKPKESMSEYIHRLRLLASNLELAGEKTEQKKLVRVLLNGLSTTRPAYSGFCSSLAYSDTATQLTLDIIEPRLLTAEADVDGLPATSAAAAMHVNASNRLAGRGNRRTGRRPASAGTNPHYGAICTWCGKKNHVEENCYSRRDGKPRASHLRSSLPHQQPHLQ